MIIRLFKINSKNENGLKKQSFNWLVSMIVSIAGLTLLTSCQAPPITQLQKIKQAGYIKVYTRISPTTMYVGERGFTGFEYDLVKQFANYLGVRVQIVTETDISKILDSVEHGKGDFAAAGLTITKQRMERLRFAPPYQEITSKLVYKQGNQRPRDFSQVNKNLTVLSNSSHSEQLHKTKKDYPNLSWNETTEFTALDLLEKVMEGGIDYTIVDSHELDLARQVEPNLSIAFNISKPEQLGWAFSQSEDDSLYAKSIEFFSFIRRNGTLELLTEHYYGHLSKFDYVGTREFLKAIDSRLSQYKSYFIEAAGKDVDWRLLAAMGYQESHWKPHARSPTGVRGLMMLTLDTAKQLGVKNRLDPKQSIFGGAKYYRMIGKKIPERIKEPDRSWFTLAGYNVGFGHLEDARRLAEQAGESPDKWSVVKEYLPLLRQKKWYSKTRYGYARGDEPVHYVSNIRQYYKVLQQLDVTPFELEKELEEESGKKNSDGIEDVSITQGKVNTKPSTTNKN